MEIVIAVIIILVILVSAIGLVFSIGRIIGKW